MDMNIKNYIRRWLRMKIYKRWGSFCDTESVDAAIDWMLSKPVTGWPVAYPIVKRGAGLSPFTLEEYYQWLRR